MNRQWICKKEKRAECLRSEISVFLALVFVLTASLILYSVEMLRTQAAKTYLITAADSAMDSLFSQYHLELWDEYRLLGLEMYAQKVVTDEYFGFLEPYFDSGDNYNWYGLTTEKDGISINTYALLTDDNGQVFEEEVKDYMLFGLALDAAGLAEGRDAILSAESAVSTDETAEEMEDCSEEAEALQEEIDALGEKVTDHNALIKELRSDISECDAVGARENIEKLRDILSEVSDEVEEVEEKTADLKESVNAARIRLDEKLASGRITEENYDQLKNRLSDFDNYTEERGEKNRELQALKEEAQENLLLLDNIEAEVDAAEEYIESWEPAQILVGYGPPEKEGGDPVPIYEDEVLDETEVWTAAAECFNTYSELKYSIEIREVDEEKSNLFDGIKELLGGELLELVIPNASEISKEKRDLNDAPSKIHAGPDTGSLFTDPELLNKLAVDEYAMLELSNLLSKENEISSAEVEYVLCGKESDLDNVSAVVAELVGLRTGFNLAYLFTDGQKLKEASALAASICGVAAGTPLVLVITFLVLSVWAAAQAVLDVRQLYIGGKVPLFHSKKTFTLTIEGLLNDFTETLKEDNKSSTGLDYQTYLRMLLLRRSRSETDYRIMDIIQGNLRVDQPDFRMDRLYASLEIRVRAGSRHFFSGLLGGDRSTYDCTAKTYYSY